MSLLRGEIIRAGNNTARVKNVYANGLIVLTDVSGTIESGTTITGDDSGETITLSTFAITTEYDLYYEDGYLIEGDYVTLDSGAFVVQDAHFTGTPSQNYQRDNYIVLDE